MNKRVFLITFFILLVFGNLAYAALWFSIRKDVQDIAAQTIADAKKEGIHFEGEISPVTGFPGPYKLSFSGKIKYQDYVLNIPKAAIKSFYIPGRPLSIILPQGAIIEGTGEPEINKIDGLSIALIVPDHVPTDITYDHINTWKNGGGTINIASYVIHKESLSIKGSGIITLDDELQPEGKLSAKMAGGIEFIKWLKDHDIIESKDAMIAGTIIGGLTKEDPETGEKAVHTALMLQNRMLFLGPLRLLSFPAIDWPHPPAGVAAAQPALLQ